MKHFGSQNRSGLQKFAPLLLVEYWGVVKVRTLSLKGIVGKDRRDMFFFANSQKVKLYCFIRQPNFLQKIQSNNMIVWILFFKKCHTSIFVFMLLYKFQLLKVLLKLFYILIFVLFRPIGIIPWIVFFLHIEPFQFFG